MKEAQRVYRKKDKFGNIEDPLIPYEGISNKIIKKFQKSYLPFKGKFRYVNFIWKRLPVDQIFELNREENLIILNRVYRNKILNGDNGSKNDAPVLKLLLFFLLEKEIDSTRTSKKTKDWMKRINDFLRMGIESQGD